MPCWCRARSRAATITGFDLGRRRKRLPGVLAIMTPDNAPRLPQPKQANRGSPVDASRCCRTTTVYYNGQHIAVVVADTLERAQHAARAGRGAQYRAGEAPIADGAMRSARPIRRSISATARGRPTAARGDPDAAFAAAPVKIDATYTTPIEHHNPMEPHATIARWERGDTA